MEQQQIYSLPPTLIIVLDKHSMEKNGNGIADRQVNFEIRLDLTGVALSPNETGERYIYDLFAVQNHAGYPGSGQDWAYAKNDEYQYWAQFHDKEVSPIEESYLVSKDAIVLYYSRLIQ